MVVSWQVWRWALMVLFGAIIFFNFGFSSVLLEWNLQTEILKGISVQLLLGIASGVGYWIVWKRI